MISSINNVDINSGVTDPTLRQRLVKAWRVLFSPPPFDAAIHYAESSVRITVGDEGRIEVAGHLNLGPGSVIRARSGGGFVIEMPSSNVVEYEAANNEVDDEGLDFRDWLEDEGFYLWKVVRP